MGELGKAFEDPEQLFVHEPRGFMGDDELAPEAGLCNSTLAVVDGLGIGLTLRKVEFLFAGADIDPRRTVS
jgi:hypothetical protein